MITKSPLFSGYLVIARFVVATSVAQTAKVITTNKNGKLFWDNHLVERRLSGIRWRGQDRAFFYPDSCPSADRHRKVLSR